MASNVVPAPYHITPDDKRGLVMVVTTTTVSFVISCLLVRIYVRTKVKEWKRDDSLLALATLFCCFQAATVYIQIEEGLGLKKFDQSRLSHLGRANFAQQILYLFTLFLSKCVVLLLYLRLTAGRKHAMLAYITIAVCAVWTVTSFILTSINCNPIAFFTQGLEVCGNITWRWLVIGVFDIFTELLIFFNAIYLVAGLHMAFRLKVIVILAFSIRLPVIVACAFRMKYIRGLAAITADPTLDGAYSVVAGQFQLDWAIMASTISCIGPFLRPFEKEGGGGSSYRRRYYAEQPYHQQYPSHRGGAGERSFNDTISFGTAIKMGPVVGGKRTSGGGLYGEGGKNGMVGQKQQHHHKHKLSLGHRGSAFSRSASPSELVKISLDLRPDFCQHEAGATRSSTAGAGAELDQLSMESNDSKRMIISKKTVVRIEREGEEDSISWARDRRSAGSSRDGGGVGMAYSRN
ncbi:hypothetical protein DIS24_g5451 [Lasiodiplodia hormozganensis]|uniref:Rhodopsin domain-containing protein n=1 Tax=Lasiodiplodia hormozganensis TaxID=869390 RepID=A0AA39YK90_9PEZI|nr:hypothetical protein DIS24_g5451 [Lasiodiplodia hormozganensis]